MIARADMKSNGTVTRKRIFSGKCTRPPSRIHNGLLGTHIKPGAQSFRSFEWIMLRANNYLVVLSF